MTFTSTSSDPDGSIASHAWDLDNDGEFDDARGERHDSFPTPGTKTVRLRVTDDQGAPTVATKSITGHQQASAGLDRDLAGVAAQRPDGDSDGILE